jgi:predicted MFS family arabinose efflux permease
MSVVEPTAIPALKQQRPWELYTRRGRRGLLLVLFLVGTSNYIDKNVIGVVLEQIKAEFHVSDTLLGVLSGFSFALLYATLGLPVARWADGGDRKRVITLSLAVWSVMTVLCGLAGTFWQLAAARVGVGAGEAGAVPPAQSLLADYYPPAERAHAIGVFMMSSTAGYAIGLILGGVVAQSLGWRAAFILVGLAGMGLVPLTHFLLKEPRHVAQFAVRGARPEATFAALRALFAKPAFRNILGAIIVLWFMSYGALVFTVSFMIRVHGLKVAAAGATFGAISAIGAVIGNLGGGALADRLAARDLRWLARLAGWALILGLPFYELAFLSPNTAMMAPLLLLAMIVLTSVIPPLFAALHVVCGSGRRALAVATVFFFANLVGLGLGPVVTGAISDHLAVFYGTGDGLRYALMIVMAVLLPAGWLMLRAARYLKQDAEE